jgi:integrase
VAHRVAGLHFFCVRTLKRPAIEEDLLYLHSQNIPGGFDDGDREEVSRLIDSARNLFDYAVLLIMYSAGLRRSELWKGVGDSP